MAPVNDPSFALFGPAEGRWALRVGTTVADMSSAFDTLGNDGEDLASWSSSTRPFDDDGYLGYDPRLPSQRFESYSTFAADEDPEGGLGGIPLDDPSLGFPASDGGVSFSHDEAIPIRHVSADSIPPSPENYDFRSDAHAEFSSAPSPFLVPESNGQACEEVGDGGVFASDGPVLPPPGEMQHEEALILL